MGGGAARWALTISLSPFPVDIITIDSPGSMKPFLSAALSPARLAAPAGSVNTPVVLPRTGIASKISSSLTATIVPLDSLTAFNALTGLRGTPTAMLSAIVFSSDGLNFMSEKKALTSG